MIAKVCMCDVEGCTAQAIVDEEIPVGSFDNEMTGWGKLSFIAGNVQRTYDVCPECVGLIGELDSK